MPARVPRLLDLPARLGPARRHPPHQRRRARARGEQLEPLPSLREVLPADAPTPDDETLDALDEVVSGDRDHDGRATLFEESLRLLLASFRPPT